MHPLDSPCYCLREINNKLKRLSKYLDFNIKVKGTEIKGAEWHKTTPQQGCTRYQVLGYPYQDFGICYDPINGNTRHEYRHRRHMTLAGAINAKHILVINIPPRR